MRRVVLETPQIWASIKFEIDSSRKTDEEEFTTFHLQGEEVASESRWIGPQDIDNRAVLQQ